MEKYLSWTKTRSDKMILLG